MRWLLGCGTLFAVAFALFAVPARLEGPMLVPISPGHGLAVADVVALVPLLGGVVLLFGGLWQRRERLDATLNRRPWLARAGIFGAGVGLGLLVASVFAGFWWWAVGAGLLTAALLGAAVMVGRDDQGAPGEEGQHHRNSSSQAVRTGRWMARREEPFAVFVFGMRLNRLRGLPRFLWGLRVLRRILHDLDAHPERGFLAGRVYRAGRTLIVVQYWASFDALDAWARDHRLPHRKPWQRYLREALDDGAMGLWHETYLASPGSWEGVYLNMPPWGLAAGVEAVEMQATRGSARERLREQRKRSSPLAADKTPP